MKKKSQPFDDWLKKSEEVDFLENSKALNEAITEAHEKDFDTEIQELFDSEIEEVEDD